MITFARAHENNFESVQTRTSEHFLIRLLTVLGFAVLYVFVVSLYLVSSVLDENQALFALSAIFTVLCITTFFFSGSKCILFTSVLSYGHILFVAMPAILIATGITDLRPHLDIPSAIQFMSIFFVLQLVMLTVSSRESGPVKLGLAVGSNYQLLALLIASVVVITGILIPNPQLSYITEPFWLVAIALSSLVVVSSRASGNLVIHGGILMTMVVTYYLVGFGGFGRLVLASYLLSIVIFFSWVLNSYLPKVLIILTTLPALAVLSLNRQAFIQAEYGTTIDSDESLGSVFGPFQSGVHLFALHRDGMLSPTWGESILTSAFFWIPRSLWESKPEGFGRAIVSVTQPHLVSVEIFSDAAPYVAEAIWDFGFVGLIPILFLVICLVRLDSRIAKWLRKARNTSTSPSEVFTLVAVVCGVSMLLNYVWGGFFTFATRSAIPILVLLIAGRLLRLKNTQKIDEEKGM